MRFSVLRAPAVVPDHAQHAHEAGHESRDPHRSVGFKLLWEMELIWPIDDDYNDTLNGQTQYPVVSDPEAYELNRLQLSNSSLPETSLVLGRQRITYDDQRFVGNVGWRQNEQTVDALRITNKSLRRLTLDLAYLNQMNRVVGGDSPVGRYTGENYLANLSYALPVGKLTGFAYLLEFDEAATDSSSTAGVRYSAEKPFGSAKLAGFASYAEQRDREGNPLDYSEQYWADGFATDTRKFWAQVEYAQ